MMYASGAGLPRLSRTHGLRHGRQIFRGSAALNRGRSLLLHCNGFAQRREAARREARAC